MLLILQFFSNQTKLAWLMLHIKYVKLSNITYSPILFDILRLENLKWCDLLTRII